MKIKFFKKEKTFKKDRLHISPSFCWQIAIGIMFIMVIVSSVFGYHLFTQINKEPDMGAVSNDGKIRIVKKERIQKVLDYFSAREQKSNQIINSPAPVIDPSL